MRQKIRCGMVYIGWYGFIGPTTTTTDISLMHEKQFIFSNMVSADSWK